jgi:CDP-paratose 2-epimerase
VLITGACGFIGTALSLHFLSRGAAVVGLDNLSRPGVEVNARELQAYPRFSFHRVDLADQQTLWRTLRKMGAVDAVFHLAGQVAVNASYRDRRLDFESNLLGSFNLLECVASLTPGAYCLYSSTNKVYGRLRRSTAVGREQSLDPCTPYGVSKAAAELYFSEYNREPIGLSTCSLRQSCIYGHHQLGTEDQGWLAWFAAANLLKRPVCIYGDGEQVRDLLFIDDLIALYAECLDRRVTGVYPVGGGEANAISLNQALLLIEQETGRPFVGITHAEPRPGDQPYFVAELSWARDLGLAWRPRTGVTAGLRRLLSWLEAHEADLDRLHGRPQDRQPEDEVLLQPGPRAGGRDFLL